MLAGLASAYSPAARVLDFGAGIGNSLPHFRRHMPGSVVHCADVSGRSLDLAERRFPGLGHPMLIEGDRIPAADSSFDIVLSACVFHHIPHEQHVPWLRELRRVARPGGLLVVFEHYPLNPLTVRAVNTCPFDENAHLLRAGQLARRQQDAGWAGPHMRYHLFFSARLGRTSAFGGDVAGGAAGRPVLVNWAGHGRRRLCVWRVSCGFPGAGPAIRAFAVLVQTADVLIGVESKRNEPFRSKQASVLSDAYWRPVWGDRMGGYSRVRDGLRDGSCRYRHLDAAQLVKHAFGLRTFAGQKHAQGTVRPVLLYLHAEPTCWPDGRTVTSAEIGTHRQEIAAFASLVAGDDVAFHATTYSDMLRLWDSGPLAEVREHVEAVRRRFGL